MGEAERLSGLVARLHRGPLSILFLVMALAWLPGFFTLPPLDRDESRFAQATKQMLETGDFISIRLGDQARDQKPVGIYWLQAAATSALDGFVPPGSKWRQVWTYRVPSFLGAFAAVALTFWMARLFAGVEAGFLAALLLGFTLLLATEAKIAKTDAVLLATILGSQSLILRAFLGAHPLSPGVTPPGWRHAAFGWACFGFGMLVKGPIIIILCLATMIGVSIWDRRVWWLRHLRPLIGIPIALAIVLPWAIAIGIETSGQFYEASLGRDFALKLVGGQETHGAPPGYYLLLAPVTFWPATLILLPALVYGFQHRREPAVRFILVWIVTAWVLFDAAPTKLPHYVLPTYPALAMLGALWLTRGPTFPKTRMERFALRASLALFVLVGFALGGAVLYAPYQFGRGADIWAYYVVALAGLAVFAAAVVVARGWRIEGIGVAAVAALLLYAAAGLSSVAAMDQLQLSPLIARAVAGHQRAGDPPPLLAGYSEPSALFLMGTNTRFATGADAGVMAAQSGGVVVVERGEQEAFLGAVQQRAARATPLQIIDGLNYSNGRALRLYVYRITPGG